jgi:hypothetical protein
MKSFASAVLLATLASAENVFDLKDAMEKVIKKTDAGELLSQHTRMASSSAMVEENIFANHVERFISFPDDPTGQYRMTKHIENMTQKIAERKQKMAMSNGNNPVYTCSDREPDGSKHDSGAFFPTFAGEISTVAPTATYSGRCFQSIDFTFAKTSDTTFDVTMNLADPLTAFCHENIFFANTEIFHMESFFRKGTHTLHFNMPTADAQADVNYNGINMFAFCEDILGEIESLWNFAKCFVGGLSDHPKIPVIGSHTPEY